MVFIQITLLPGANEFESLNIEIQRILIVEGHFAEMDYPYTKKPKFSTLGSIIEIARKKPLTSFTPDVSIRYFLSFNAGTMYKKYNL